MPCNVEKVLDLVTSLSGSGFSKAVEGHFAARQLVQGAQTVVTILYVLIVKAHSPVAGRFKSLVAVGFVLGSSGEFMGTS